MSTPEFSLGLLDRSHPISADGHSVHELHPGGRRIETLEDLNALHALFDVQAIILIKRAAIGAMFMESVSRQAFDGHEYDRSKHTHRWNRIGAKTSTNAVPHIHDFRNCHAVPVPSETSTAFFSRKAVIEAVAATSRNRRHPFDIREAFSKPLSSFEDDGDETAFFRGIHVADISRDGDMPVLQAIRDIQKRVADMGGVLEANLGIDGYGIVSIPAHSVHARSTLDSLMRDESEESAWRFFGDPIR